MFNFSLTKRYIPALTLVVLFVIFTNFLSQRIIESNNEYANIINISGKQRMLSQRLIVLASNYINLIKTNSNGLKVKNELMTSLQEIKQSHKYLLTKVLNKNLQKLYFEDNLNSRLSQYLTDFNNLLQTNDIKYLNHAIDESKIILTQLDNIVKEYESYANEQLKCLSNYEFYLMLSTLVIILLEIIFVFRPSSLKIEQMTDIIKLEKEYIHTVVESTNDAIIAIDWTGKITTYNQKAEDIFGWTKEEMIGSRKLINIIPEKYKKLHIKASTAYLNTGKSSGVLGTTVELEGIRKDGTIFPISISFGSKYKIKGAVVVASIADITEQKNKDLAMIQQSKMASMGEMISNIAHQWRQPLSLISTLSSGAIVKQEMEILESKELIETLENIEKTVQFLSKTIDDFRNFYKVSTNKEVFLTNQAIATIEAIVKDSYQNNNIEIVKVFEQDNIQCYGVPSQLSQVILNIMNNAKDILLENKIKDKKVKIIVRTNDDNIIMKFYDSGLGIPEDILPKVFEPYFTTKHKSNGTGIGLHMSYEIITKQFQGRLLASNEYFSIEDTEYFGACFTIEIPTNMDKA